MKSIDDISKELYAEVLRLYNSQEDWNKKAFSEILDEKLQAYNEKVSPLIMGGVYSQLNSSFSADTLPDVVLDEPKLSKMLYRNSKKVSAESLAILNDGIRAKKPIRQMAMKLYDGYGFNDKEILDVKRKLPLYLRRELKNDKVSKELIKYVDNIKTKPLKTALKQIIDKIDDTNKIGLGKALKVALEEKSRYYASRIADTEHHRAVNLARAKEYIDDPEVEFVKHSMSSRHPMVDICDYYNKLDSGYGKGIYKKESAVALPHHPHCHCRYHAHYDKVKKTSVKNPEKETLEKFSVHDRIAILGSHDKLRRFYDGESAKDIFNSSRPKYPIKSYGEVLGYNSGMKKIEEKIIGKFDSIKNNINDDFHKLWMSKTSFENHIEKRIKQGHIVDKNDYILKTLSCLSNCDSFVFAEHKNSWDNICYNHSKSWAVIFNEQGQIMTSYNIEPKSKSFEASQLSIKAKIKKGVPNERFKQYFKQLRK